uniref:Matrin 3-like 1.1 n=1 Tax=Hucho hucho TaxID=62062 RepID=A0A4W5PIM5_9TELE
MSQKIPSDSSQKGFAVGRGLLAAAETLNFSMNEQRSDSLHHGSTSRQLHSMSSGMGGGEGDCDPQLSRGGGGSHIGNSMKLFASLGLSPADLDVLAQIPEDNISVETLPQLIMQLKNRKVDSDRRMACNSRGDLSGLSSEPSYRASRDDWDDMRVGKLGGSMGQASAHAQQGDLGYSSIQDTSAGRFELDYGHGSGGRDPGWYSDLSHDRYSGMGMGPPSAADSVFMTRRMGSPSQGKVQDFLGVIPHMFPHVCSLCDFDVHSTMEWNQHTDGLRHTENQRLLLQMYPEWDPHMATSRGGGSHLLETSNQSVGLLGPIPMAGRQQAGGGRVRSGWGNGGSNVGSGKVHQPYVAPKQIRGNVVVAKYDRNPQSNKALFALVEPFGTLCEHMVLKNKAFLEMETHREARDVVNYYHRNPAVLNGNQITFYVSKELMVIEKDSRTERINREAKQVNDPSAASRVVFFSNLPRENEKKEELLTIARRFGTVEKHLFLNDESFVQMESAEDAEMLVKYYRLNPLTMQGKTVRLNICTKYKTLNVSNRSNKLMDDKRRRSSSSTGPKDKGSSSRSAKSSSSSSSKAEEDKKEPPKGEDCGAESEGSGGEGSEREGDGSGKEGVGSGDEVAGMMEGDEAEDCKGEGDQGSHNDGPSEDKAEAVTEDPDAANTSLESQKEKEPAPDSDDVPSTGKVLSSSDVTEKAEGAEVEEGTVPGLEEKAEGETESEQMETEATTDEPETEDKDDMPSAEPATSSEMHEEQLPADQEEEGSMEQDFPENMDDFVTLDELAEDEDLERQDSSSKEKYSSSGSSKKMAGLRVVNVVGFKRAYGFLNEILALAKPFGTVVQHLVLDVRPEAFLQLTSEEEAKAMVNFYSGNVTPTVCGKSVEIYHSQTYATIQSGRVVYVGQIPHFKSSDASLLKIAEPFGKVRRYFLNRSRNECFIEMECGEDAERMAETYRDTPPKFEGKRLTVYVSRKYKQLKYGHRPPAADSEEKKRPSKRERSGSETSSHRSSAAKSSAKQDEEPQVKKSREETASSSADEPEKEDKEEMVETPTERSEVEVRKVQGEYGQTSENSAVHQIDTDMNIKMEENEAPISIVSVKNDDENREAASTPSQAEGKLSSTSPVPLGPYEPNNPVGVEYVKMGYYCRVCFLFYSNEETAKKVHCSSQSHYQKLKKHLEKEKAKAQSTTVTKIPV